MTNTTIRWRWVLPSFLLVELLLIAAAVAWVAFYSYVVHPGEPDRYYEAYASAASPIVSLVAGAPLFFALGDRFRRSLGADAVKSAIAVSAIYTTLDVLLVVTWPGATLYHVVVMLVNAAAKLAAIYLGARGRRNEVLAVAR
jgi:hypothetical protein